MPAEVNMAANTADEAARKARVLHDRAVSLAHKTDKPEEAWILTDIVEFTLAGETYAVESAFVREVQPLRGLTPVPCTPPFITGIVNIRGQIVTVIDLKKFFDLPARGITDLDKLIILRSGGMEIGILADTIAGVRSIPLGAMETSSPAMAGFHARYLKGIGGDRTALVDVEKLLSDERIVVREEA